MKASIRQISEMTGFSNNLAWSTCACAMSILYRSAINDKLRSKKRCSASFSVNVPATCCAHIFPANRRNSKNKPSLFSQVEALKEFGISTSKEIPEKLLLEAEDECLEGVFAND